MNKIAYELIDVIVSTLRSIERALDLEELEKDLPRPPRPVSLEEVVGSTVSAVIEEEQELLQPLVQPSCRSSLPAFSLRLLSD